MTKQALTGLLISLFLTLSLVAQEETKPIRIEFKLVEDDSQEDNLVLGDEVLFSTKDISSAELVIDIPSEEKVAQIRQMFPDYEPEPALRINFKFTGKNKQKLFDITKKHQKRRLAILIDDKLLMAPKIYEPISQGTVSMVGNISEEEAKSIVDRINNKEKKPSLTS